MKLRLRTGVVAVQVALLAACAHSERAGTLATLHRVQPDTTDVRVDDGLLKAVQGYRQFLQETPASDLTPEAMRRRRSRVPRGAGSRALRRTSRA